MCGGEQVLGGDKFSFFLLLYMLCNHYLSKSLNFAYDKGYHTLYIFSVQMKTCINVVFADCCIFI